MRIADTNIAKNQQDASRKASFAASMEEPDDMELTMLAKPLAALDKSANIFDADAQKIWSGINTAPSVFTQQAIFKKDNSG